MCVCVDMPAANKYVLVAADTSPPDASSRLEEELEIPVEERLPVTSAGARNSSLKELAK